MFNWASAAKVYALLGAIVWTDMESATFLGCERWSADPIALRADARADCNSVKSCAVGAVADRVGRYRPSPRPFPVRLAEVDYGEHEIVRTVPSSKDYMRFRSRFWKVPEAFRGERVATRPMSRDGCYGVFFASHQIAAIEHLMKKREMKRQLSP